MTPAELKETLGREFPHRRSDPQPKTLWHYTDSAGLRGILSAAEIWATHFAHTNDTEELRFGHDMVARAFAESGIPSTGLEGELVARLRQAWARAEMLPTVPFYIAAFCDDEGNSLSQWRGYGAFGAGYSIGFRDLVPRDSLMLVRYPDPRNIDGYAVAMIKETVARGAALLGTNPPPELLDVFQEHLLNALVLLALRAKHRAFLDEREWRLVSYYPNVVEYGARKRGLVPYTRISVANSFYPARTDIPPHIDLEGIYVGPTQNAEASVAAVVQYLGTLGYENADKLVHASGIPFRG
jgi:hypothetical protein